MAQEEGFEPPTNRLTADCSTTELLLNRNYFDNKKLVSLSILNLMRSFSLNSICFALFFLTVPHLANAKPEALAALFQTPKTVLGKKKIKAKALLPVPPEYQIYFKAKALLEHPSNAAEIEKVQREILLSRTHSQTRTLEKDLDEVFYALELKRGTRLLMKKLWREGLDADHRALGGLLPFKWIYDWDENDSKQLSLACSRTKTPDLNCLAIAKRVMDAFPKDASETETLHELTFPDPTPAPLFEISGDRLYQTYTEKKDKDEEAFQIPLGLFESGKDADLLKSAKDFIADYPKSVLRFRATFLMAESYNRTGNKKEAEPLYQSLIDQTPLSYYAIVSSERLGVNLRDKVKKDPLQIDQDLFNPNLSEQLTLERAKILFAHRDFDEVGTEIDTLVRVRNYSNDFLLYLARFAFDANQNVVSYKFITELIQRKYENILSDDILYIVFPDRYSKEIEAEAAKDQIDPLLVQSLMKQESAFKASVLSSSGALGLMQLMPFTALETKDDVVLRTLKEPGPNIEVGTKYLADLLRQYDGNVPYALAAYNAGPHRVAKWRKELKPDATMVDFMEYIPFKETRDYVATILRNRYWYQYRKGLPAQSVFEAWKQAQATPQ
jgi:soluble lytic murein transglycosylase-like protein/TolA-binding protein